MAYLRFIAERFWRRDRGVLSYEWILLITVVAVGVVGGMTAARDAIISELGDIAGAIVSVDQSYVGFGCEFVDPPVEVTSCRPDEDPGGP